MENETRRQELEQQNQIHEQLQQKLVIQKKEKEELEQEWTNKMNIQRQETLSEIQKLKSVVDSNQIEMDSLRDRNQKLEKSVMATDTKLVDQKEYIEKERTELEHKSDKETGLSQHLEALKQTQQELILLWKSYLNR